MPLISVAGGRVLSTAELRQTKPGRADFAALPRRPITVVLDRVTGNYNIGAIFRLCDAFRVDRLVIAGTTVDLRKRRLAQAGQGSQHWVPWHQVNDAVAFVTTAKAAGAWVVVAEQTTDSLDRQQVTPAFPACLVLGSERTGVSQGVVDLADATVAIAMAGMANSLNVATAAAILLYWLSRSRRTNPSAAPLQELV